MTSKSLTSSNNVVSSYQHLLKLVTELQSNLQRTATMASNLKSDNDTLRRNYEDTKATLLRMRRRYKETRCSLILQTEDADGRSKISEIALNNARKQLDSMALQIENLKNQQTLFDMDLLRSKVKEEIELDYQSEKTKIIQELDKWKQSYLKEKRANELCSVEYKEYICKTEREMHIVKDSNSQESSHMLRIMNLLKRDINDVDNEGDQKKINLLKRRNKDMEEAYQELQQELIDLQTSKEQVESELIQVESLHQNEISVSLSQCSILETDKKILERKNQDLENDLDQLKNTILNSKLDFENMQKNLSIGVNEYKQNESNLSDKIYQLQYEAEQDRSLYENGKNNLMQENIRFRNNVFELEKRCKEIQSNFLAKVEIMTTFEENIRGEARDKLQKALQENQSLKSQLNNTTNELNHWKVSQSEVIHRLTRECELCRSDVNRITRENEEMTKGNASNQYRMNDLKSNLETYEGRLKESINQFSSTNDELTKSNEVMEDLKAEKEILQSKISYMEKEYKSSLIISTREKDSRKADILKLQKLIKQSKYSAQALENKLGKINAKLVKEKKKSEAYKLKALESHRKTNEMKSLLFTTTLNNQFHNEDESSLCQSQSQSQSDSNYFSQEK